MSTYGSECFDVSLTKFAVNLPLKFVKIFKFYRSLMTLSSFMISVAILFTRWQPFYDTLGLWWKIESAGVSIRRTIAHYNRQLTVII